jgi:copper homeostasis protein
MGASRLLVEVCCGSLADALIAEAAGAARIELNAGLQLGGLTPSAGLVRKVLEAVTIPVIAMVRPRPGGFCYSAREWETVVAEAEWLLNAGVAGVAFGALDAASRIDMDRTTAMRRLVGDRTLVFHRAFDLVDGWQAGLEQLIDAGIDRVMTSGQRLDANTGAETIRAMIGQAAGRIEILPAGGIRASNVAALLTSTGATAVHGSFSASVPDPGYPPVGGIRFAAGDQPSLPDAEEIRAVGRMGEASGHDSR